MQTPLDQGSLASHRYLLDLRRHSLASSAADIKYHPLNPHVMTLPQPGLHPLFETLGYAGGYWFYRNDRASRGDLLTDDRRWLVIAAAAVGALLGSRILGVLQELPRPGFHWQIFFALSGGGKTIVGGLLGGWIGVELIKKVAGIHSRTGDLFAIPLCIGIAIGRIGCFFAGIADDTYGQPTSLPWGVNFGDGIHRHPTQLYEIIFLSALAAALHYFQKRPHPEGQSFRAFMAAYLAWRLLIDFIKPQPIFHGLSMIQWACLIGIATIAALASRSRGAANA